MKFTRLYDQFFIYFHEIFIFCINFLFYCPLRLFYLMFCLFLINVHQNNVRSDFYNLAPRNKQFKLPAHTAHPLCRPWDNQRLDASVALVKIQIPHISQTLAVIYIDDLFPRQIAKTHILPARLFPRKSICVFFQNHACLKLYVKAEQNHISVLYHIILAFHSDNTFFTRCSEASVVQKILVVDNFRLDKASLEVRMNLAGCLRCLGSLLDRPCTALILACRQKADQTENTVACRHQLVQSAGFHAEIVQVFLLLFL